MRVITPKEIKMAKVKCSGRTVSTTLVTLLTILCMGKEAFIGKMGNSTKESGNKVKWTALGGKNGQTDEFTKDSTKMITDMELVSTPGPMGNVLKANLLITDVTVLG